MSEQFDRQKSYNNQEKKKARRTRKDQQGRNFTCNCGKSYLSYPALYTHIKTKHQGKMPRQQEGGLSPKQNIQQETQIKDPIYQIKEIIDKYFPGDNYYAYPTPLSREDHEYIQKIVVFWEQNKQRKLEDPSNNLSENINTVMGRFLYEVKPQLKTQGYLFIKQLICSLKKQICQQYKDPTYCNTGYCLNLINCFNQFMLKSKKQQHIKRGSPVNNSILTCKILQNLGAWIFQQRYTNYLVKINTGIM